MGVAVSTKSQPRLAVSIKTHTEAICIQRLPKENSKVGVVRMFIVPHTNGVDGQVVLVSGSLQRERIM